MQKSILAIGLLAICVMAQRDTPGPPPPAPDRPPMSGTPPREDMPDDGEGEEPCPPRTGREWICRMDYWDNNEERVVRYMDRQKCDDRDMCYLGPIVSRYLNEPWERKWMCGPKPCQWEGSIDGQFKSEMNECPSGDCTVGPFDIMINGTYRVSARFCSQEPEDEEEMEEMEEMMEPMWASPVCSVNSSVNGEESIKDCEGGELCMRGPVNVFQRGTQYRIFLCTKTPSRPMPPMGSKAVQHMSMIHYKLSAIADALVMGGHVFRMGPHETIYMIGKKLKELKGHLEYAEQRAEEMKEMGGDGKVELPMYVKEMFNPIHIAVVKLHNQVIAALGTEEGERVMRPLRDAMDELSITFQGKPDLKRLVGLLRNNIEELAMKLRDDDWNNDYGRAMYRSTHEIMLEALEAAKKHMGDEGGDKIMEIKEDMEAAMVYVWMFMSGGRVVPGNTPTTLAKKLVEAFTKLHNMMMMANMTPRDRLYDIGKDLDKLKEIIKEGRLNTREGREFADMVALNKLLSLRYLTDSLPNTDILTPMVTEIVNHFNILWNHITGGFTPPVSRPEMAIQMMKDGLERLLGPLEEGERMRDRGRPQPNRPSGGQRPSPGSVGDSRVLREIQDRLAEIGRRLEGGDRDMSPGERAMHNVVDFMRKLHEHFAGIRRIPEGPEGLILSLSEHLEKLIEDMMEKRVDMAGEVGDAIRNIREGVSGLADHVGDPSRGEPREFFRKMMEGMMTVARDAMEKARQFGGGESPVMTRIMETIRNMMSGQGGPGQGGPGQVGPGQGGRGQGGPGGQGGPQQPRPQGQGNDDLRRQLEDIQRTIRDLMERDSRGDNGGFQLPGPPKRGGYGMDGSMMDMEEPCDEPFWMKQIPAADKMRWGHGEDSFFGPMPEKPEDSRK